MAGDRSSEDPVRVAAFRDRYLADQETGSVRPPAAYQALFPGIEELIAREYARLAGAAGSTTVEGGAFSPPTETASATLAEDELLGPYRLRDELGRGGQGAVYLAEDQRLHRKVALKVLSHLGPGAEEALSRFRREAEVASRLDHPGICAVYDAGVERGLPYIAMRYVEGETLARRIAMAREERTSGCVPLSEVIAQTDGSNDATPTPTSSRGRPAVFKVLALLDQVARALHVAHEAGIIHRDIKPSNVMVTPEGQPVILDFGLAHVADPELPSLTRTGDVFGTPAYLAPEQILGEPRRHDRRADVYALGVTLYESLTLHRPFEAPTREALYRAVLGDAPFDAQRFNPAITRDLKVVLDTALEKNPDRRYQTALDFAEELRALREYRPIRARPLSLPARVIRWSRRRPAQAALVGTILVALVVVAGLGGFLLAALPDAARGREVDRQRDIEEKLDAGFLALLRGQIPESEREFKQVLAEDRGNVEAIGGLVALKLRFYERSEAAPPGEAARKALQVVEEHGGSVWDVPEFQWIRACIHRRLGSEEEAERLEQEAQQGCEKTALRHCLDGIEPWHRGWRGDIEGGAEALRCFQAAIYKSPKPRLMHFWLLGEAAAHAEEYAITKDAVAAIHRHWGDQEAALLFRGALLESKPGGVEILERLIAINPTDWYEAYTYLGEQAANRGDYDEAIPLLQKAVDLRPSWSYGVFRLACWLDSAGRRSDAEAAIDRAIELNPYEPLYYWYRCRILGGQSGRYEEALRAAEKALEVDPEFGWVHLLLAQLHLGRRELDAAVDDVHRALEITSAMDWQMRYYVAHLLKSLDRLLIKADRHDDAREALERAVQLAPQNAGALDALAWHLIRPDLDSSQWEPQRALDLAEKAVELTRGCDDPLLYTLGKVHEALVQPEDAITAYRRAMKSLNPRTRPATYPAHLARLLRKANQPDEAREVLERVVQVLPENAVALTFLAEHLVHPDLDPSHWDVPIARTGARKAVEISKGKNAWSLDTLARALHLSGLNQEAAKRQKEAIAVLVQRGGEDARIPIYRERLEKYRTRSEGEDGVR